MLNNTEGKNPPVPAPSHIGIIMDGNGRWAKQRNLKRTQGHLEGLKSAKAAVEAAAKLGVKYLTLYIFSTENWKRTAEEVAFIMGLVKKYLRGELNFFRKNHIRILHSGDRDTLPGEIVREITEICEDTKEFDGLSVILALNYGGRDELVRAVRRIVRHGAREEDITQELIQKNLDNPGVPDPDLIIRTAGEYRTSNFLLWEAAYTEYYISDKLWPDWTGDDLEQAVRQFQTRERRFGGVNGVSGE